MQINLVYFKPDGGRKDVSLDKPNVVIGRRPDCDVRVPEIGVSRRHCELVVVADTVTVRDLDSSNGTYVNGERVEQKTIAAGDQIQVGAVLLTVQIDGQPADLAPPPEARVQSPADGIDVELAGAEDEVFAQMMMDDDDDDDSISALELLEDED